MIEEEGIDVFEASDNLRLSKELPKSKNFAIEKRKYSFRRKSTITTNSDDRFFDSFIDNEFTLIEQNSKDSICLDDIEEVAPESLAKLKKTVKTSRKV
jgi:hypothetical protein